MAGTVRRLGRYRTSNGPDLAQVGVSEQLVSHTTPSSPSADFIAYRVGGYVGNWGGQATIRFGIWESGGSGAPGALLARTVETSPTVSYVDGGGGQMRTANLETPLAISTSASVAVGIASRNSAAGVAMYQAQDISEPNENFYRKNISGTNLQSGSGSSASNEGQLTLHIEGEYNVAPNTPGAVTRSGSNERRPVMTANFSDDNETLNNGASYDYLAAHEHEWLIGSALQWSRSYSANASERSNGASSRQTPGDLPYGTTITYRVRHRDRLGEWSPWRTHTFSIDNPNNAPHAPELRSPDGDVPGTVRPTLRFIHRDPDGDSSNRMQVQVQTAGGSNRWDYAWNASIADGGLAQINYNGAALQYHTPYRWRARTRDTSNEWGPWSGWMNFTPRHTNRRPNMPSNISGTGTIYGTRTTTVSMDFTDSDWPYLPNGQVWERFEAKHVRLRRVSDNVLVYNPGIQTTTGAERSNRRSSTTITVPSYDVLYQWEERHRDRWGSWSPWRTYPTQILARAAGAMERPLSPRGFINDPANPGDVSAVYVNSSPINATTIQFTLRSESGVNQAHATFTGLNLSPGTTFTRTWQEAFPGIVLGQGRVYSLVARAIVSGQWTQYSGSAGMTVNSRPDTPILYEPVDGQARSSLPLLSVQATDPNSQNPSSDLVTTFELYNQNEDLIDTSTGYYNPRPWNDRVHSYWPSAITVGDYGVYYWRAKASDGILESSWSDLWSFHYAPVPSVEITQPASGEITSMHPELVIAADAHTHWRIVGRDTDNTIVYDTGQRPGQTSSHTVSSSLYWIGGERWNNHETFLWTAMVRNSAGLWGESDALSLTLEYIPPEPFVIETVDEMAFTGAKGTHYAVIQTSQPDVLEEAFIRTIVDRVEIDGPAGNEIPESRIPSYFEEGNGGVTAFADFEMTSNQWYRYAFRYEVQAGVDVIESEPVYAEAMISFHGTLLHMPFDPLSTYVWLPYGEQQYEPEVGWYQGHSEVMTTNGRAPHGYSNSTDYVEWRCVSTLVPREGATTEQQRDALRRIWKYQNKRYAPSGRPESICFREGRGGDDGLVIGRMSEPVRRHSYTRLYTAEFVFRELEEIPVEGGGQ